jgi:ADP-ribose pyrophosphatase YjhB (NUDIX family)
MITDSKIIFKSKESNSLITEYNSVYSLVFPSTVEEWFQKEWKRQLSTARQRKTLLFNGSLFHVAEITKSNGKISLKLGETNYRAYVCSRGAAFRNKFPDYVPSKPLAACVAIVTSDNKLLVEKRKGVDVHEGMYHVVGGFIDPSKDLDKFKNPDPNSSIIREVKEETGLMINRDQLVFLGLAEDTIVPHFELCFFSKLAISSEQVAEIIYNSITDSELNQPVFIDYTKNKINEFFQRKKISPTGRNCIHLSICKIDR